jgi:hypothetical protein
LNSNGDEDLILKNLDAAKDMAENARENAKQREGATTNEEAA